MSCLFGTAKQADRAAQQGSGLAVWQAWPALLKHWALEWHIRPASLAAVRALLLGAQSASYRHTNAHEHETHADEQHGPFTVAQHRGIHMPYMHMRTG